MEPDETTVEKLRRIYTAAQRGDTGALTQELSHDIEWVLPDSVPWGGVHHGTHGVEAVGDIFRDHVDGLWADPEEFIFGEDIVVVLGQVHGHGLKTGDHFAVPFAHVWRIQHGTPSGFRAYFDTVPILQAIGEVPEKAGG